MSAAAAARAVAECRRRGLVDDLAAARLWAGHWMRRGYAWSAIRQKLSAKGIDEPAIREAAQGLDVSADEVARARQLVRQRTRSSAGQARLARMLASRGFDEDVIGQVLTDSVGS